MCNTVSVTLYSHWVVNMLKSQQRLLEHAINMSIYLYLTDVLVQQAVGVAVVSSLFYS